MPVFTVEKSIVIAAPCGDVYPLVRDFAKWKAWSPWLIAEPDAKLEYYTNPDAYSWDGKVTGSGRMELVEEQPGKSMDCKLSFFKPWKSENSVGFHFRETGQGTEVKWTMKGKLPFFLFFMKPMMTAMIGMDYERGLKMLADLAEKGSVPSVLEFSGNTKHKGFNYVGIRTEGRIDKISDLMDADLKSLGVWIEQSGTKPAGSPFAVYEKWQCGKGLVEYVIGFPVAEIPANPPGHLIVGKLPDCSVYRIKHTGPYRHLGNAWAAGMMRGRAKLFAQSKSIHPFEIYETDPTSGVDEKDIVTVVCFPLKGA